MGVDAFGNPTAVAPGQPIASSWGNAVVATIVGAFPTVADRDSAIPAPRVGQCAYTITVGLQVWTGAAWATVMRPDGKPGTVDYLPLTGGTLTGTLIAQTIQPDTDLTRALGTSTRRYSVAYANVVRAANIQDADLVNALVMSASGNRTLRDGAGATRLTIEVAGATVTGRLFASSYIDTDTYVRSPTWRDPSGINWLGSPGAGIRTFYDGAGDARMSVRTTGVTVAGELSVSSHIIGATRLYLAAPLSTTNNTLPGWRHNTAAAADGWEFMRLSSSVRYKVDVRPIDVARQIDIVRRAGAKLVSWREKGAPKRSPRYSGINAEDAVDIVPDAVVRDEQGRPDAVDPSNAFAVPVLATVAALLARVEHLESRLAAIEGTT